MNIMVLFVLSCNLQKLEKSYLKKMMLNLCDFGDKNIQFEGQKFSYGLGIVYTC